MENPEVGSPPDRVRRRLRRPLSRKLAVTGAVLAAVLLGGCQIPSFGMYRGATAQGKDTFKLWQGFMIASIVIGGIVLLLILWAVLRYRRKSSEIPRQTQYHIPLEITYTVVPVIIVLVLFVFTVITENNVDATPSNASQTVNVTAFQWGWRFQYPGTGVFVQGETTDDPEMVIPAGQNVRIQLRSADVIHGFYVPRFNFSRYAQPGVLNVFDLNVTHPGVYRGQCSELCGLYHSLMYFRVKAVSADDFTQWLHQKERSEIHRAVSSIASAKRAIANAPGGKVSSNGGVKGVS